MKFKIGILNGTCGSSLPHFSLLSPPYYAGLGSCILRYEHEIYSGEEVDISEIGQLHPRWSHTNFPRTISVMLPSMH